MSSKKLSKNERIHILTHILSQFAYILRCMVTELGWVSDVIHLKS